MCEGRGGGEGGKGCVKEGGRGKGGGGVKEAENGGVKEEGKEGGKGTCASFTSTTEGALASRNEPMGTQKH